MIPGMLMDAARRRDTAASILDARTKDVPAGEEKDSTVGIRTAVEELLAAIKANDVQGAIAALSSFHQIHEDVIHEEGEGSEEEEVGK